MARLSKEQFLDRTRYSFDALEVDLPELGGSVEVRALSNKDRNEFVRLTQKAGKTKRVGEANRLAAEALAIAISDPVLTAEEIEGVLEDQPATASDRILKELVDLLGPDTDEDDEDEEDAARRREFRTSDDD